jgi:hypothetical protein
MNILNLYNIELLMNLSLDFVLQMLIVSISLGLILFASSLGRKVLDHGHKLLTTVAASTTIYNNINKSTGDSGSDEEDKDKDKDKSNKEDNKEDKTNTK